MTHTHTQGQNMLIVGSEALGRRKARILRKLTSILTSHRKRFRALTFENAYQAALDAAITQAKEGTAHILKSQCTHSQKGPLL